MIVSGSLVRVNGVQRSFQASMKCWMAAIRSATVGKLPRRSACRVMIEKNASTRFSHDPDVGVKCSRTRGCRLSQARTAGCADRGMVVGGVVVDHHVQPASRIGGRHLLQEAEELLMAVPLGAGLGHLAGRDLERGEQRGGAVPDV